MNPNIFNSNTLAPSDFDIEEANTGENLIDQSDDEGWAYFYMLRKVGKFKSDVVNKRPSPISYKRPSYNLKIFINAHGVYWRKYGMWKL